MQSFVSCSAHVLSSGMQCRLRMQDFNWIHASRHFTPSLNHSYFLQNQNEVYTFVKKLLDQSPQYFHKSRQNEELIANYGKLVGIYIDNFGKRWNTCFLTLVVDPRTRRVITCYPAPPDGSANSQFLSCQKIQNTMINDFYLIFKLQSI